jgi:O-antigen ligase
MAKKYMVSHYVFEHRINSTLSSPAVLADIFMVIFVIGTYLFIESKNIKVKIFLIFTLIIQFAVIFLSGCRTNFILIGIYLLFLVTNRVWKFIKKTKWYINLSAFILLVVIGFVALHTVAQITHTRISKLPVINRIHEWNVEYKQKKRFKKVFLKGRFGHWRAAENMIEQNPLWGIGSGLFEQKYKAYHVKDDLFWYARAHCVPLRICAEGGFVTLISFLILLVLTLIRLSYGFTKRARKMLT